MCSGWKYMSFSPACAGSELRNGLQIKELLSCNLLLALSKGGSPAVRRSRRNKYLHDSFIELRPENPAFNSIILSREDMNNVVIEGKAVGFCRDI